jgi:hypothetical protein
MGARRDSAKMAVWRDQGYRNRCALLVRLPIWLRKRIGKKQCVKPTEKKGHERTAIMTNGAKKDGR